MTGLSSTVGSIPLNLGGYDYGGSDVGVFQG